MTYVELIYSILASTLILAVVIGVPVFRRRLRHVRFRTNADNLRTMVEELEAATETIYISCRECHLDEDPTIQDLSERFAQALQDKFYEMGIRTHLSVERGPIPDRLQALVQQGAIALITPAIHAPYYGRVVDDVFTIMPWKNKQGPGCGLFSEGTYLRDNIKSVAVGFRGLLDASEHGPSGTQGDYAKAEL